jgi:hypothetical protein
MHHVHHHFHHVRGGLGSPRRRRSGRRFEGDFDRLIAFLEERQRDHEQAAADLADKIRHLKEYRTARRPSAEEPVPAEAEGAATESSSVTES